MSDCTCTAEEYCPSCWERITAIQQAEKDREFQELLAAAYSVLSVHTGALIQEHKPMTRTLQEVYEWCKVNTRLCEHDQSDADLEKIAAHFGAEVDHAGGGIYVVIIPNGPREAIVVSDELIGLYRTDKDYTDHYELFWDCENPVEFINLI